MGKIYESQEDYDKAFEEEFRNKIEEIAYYQGNIERTTIDGEWTESELKSDIYDEVKAVLEKEGYAEKFKYIALRDRDLLKTQYLTEYLCNNFDVIETYNKNYDKHRNDKPMKFGIHYFDEAVRRQIKITLDANRLA